jgi:replicative DNA helicase
VNATDPRLPRAHKAERYLITCVLGWADRAPEIVPLLDAREFCHPLHRNLWKAFRTQLDTIGEVDPLAAGKQFNCCDYLLELSADVTTTADAANEAEAVREAARARALYDVCQRAANALLRGRTADSVLAQLNLALEGIDASSVA